MRTPPDPVLYSALAFAAVLTVAGTLTSLAADPRSEVRPAAASNSLEGLINKGARRFTEDDFEPIIDAMHNAGIEVFLVTIDPVTGNTTLEVGEDATPHLDIKPGSCPNSVNIRPDHGSMAAFAARVTVGVLGNAFDVTQIDIDSTRMTLADTLLGHNVTRPVHTSFADVGTPFTGRNCGCHDLTGDGILDFVAQFDKASMILKLPLDQFPNNTQVPIRVYGMLNEGRGIFSSRDCVRVITHGSED